MPHTAEDVAKWMLSQLEKQSRLYQETAVHQIRQLFGPQFTYINPNGNYGIGKDVLKEFRKLSPDVIWEKGERAWRLRTARDKAGRQQE